MVCLNWQHLDEKWKKIVKFSIISFVVLFSYIFLFAVDADDNAFLITGGAIGFVSSSIVVLNCLSRWDSNAGGWPPQISLLFWRALCETGIGVRYLLQPAFNILVCGSLTCTRDTGNPNLCGFPSFMLEFFVLASEFWFLCNGLDLYYSITNPFFSYNKRVMYYHVFVWSAATFFAASPFFLVADWKQIYGFWFINPNIDDSANCWIKITFNNYAWPIWVYFFVPLLVIYMVCLFSLVTAYLRLRRGVTRSFLPRMRLLIMNTVNLVVHMLYWTVFVLFYSWTFWTKQDFKSDGNQPTNNIIFFVMGSKGCSALLVWILTANNSQLGIISNKTNKAISKNGSNLPNNGSSDSAENNPRDTISANKTDDTETIDANKALREEVLSFATAGIRASARAGAKLTPDRKSITRRPQQHDSSGSDDFKDLINPRFFLRFILGYTDELTALEELVSNKQRSVNETFMRQTVTVMPSNLSAYLRNRSVSVASSRASTLLMNPHSHHSGSHIATVGGMNTGAGGSNGVNGAGTSGNAKDEDDRLSQRSTVVTGSDQKQVYERASARPSMFARFSSTFMFGNNKEGGSRLSQLDKNMRAQNGDPENGLEMDSFANSTSETGGRRSSNMIETDVHSGQESKAGGVELFDLTSTQRYFWNSVYNFFLDPSESVEFTEFEPFHFRRVRLAAGITDAIYSMYFATTIKERLTEGGASGAFFFFSKGEKCIAKSCTAEEIDTLKNNASAYADYMERNPHSVISRIYGAYRLQIYGNALYFFVMNNIFLNAEGLPMNEKYDIKGSWVARNATPPHNNMTVTCTHCEQKYTYCTVRKKKANKASRSQRIKDLKHMNSLDGSMKSDGSNPSSTASATTHNVLNNLAGFGLLDTAQEVQSPLTASVAPKSPSMRLTTTAQQQQPQPSLMGGWSPSIYYPRTGSKTGEAQEAEDQTERGGCPYTVSGEHEPNVILKDNDIKYKIRLPRNTTESLIGQIRSDVDFLFSIGVMDYSLLVGVHNTEYEVMSEDPNTNSPNTPHTLVRASHSSSFYHNASNSTSNGNMSLSSPSFSNFNGVPVGVRASSAKHGPGLPRSAAENVSIDTETNNNTFANSGAQEAETTGGDLGFARKLEVYRVVGPDAYFMGIIDFQQKWTITKRLERFIKVNIYGCDPDGTSAIEPFAYRDRFLKKIEDILDSDIGVQTPRALPTDPLLGAAR